MSQTGLPHRLEQFLINLVDEVGLSSWKIQGEGDSTTVVLRFAGPPSDQANIAHYRKKSRSQVKRDETRRKNFVQRKAAEAEQNTASSAVEAPVNNSRASSTQHVQDVQTSVTHAPAHCDTVSSTTC
ncbi:hypothetical protein V1264_019924 [Littorina saxatilis]|uniref:Uncharacterized protein n=1 Tax=Littorina saxatilis TaxID=31220 RepID=A0AAN9BDP5_9CAEN